jgi:GTP-binding protein
MEILKAEFVKGVIGGDYTTNDTLSQIAFLGRSNAGKSSVINSLTGRKNLVKSSKVPGKTIEANFFRINDSFYLVDFPGYGFAKRSIADRNRMIKRIFWYLEFSNVKPQAVCLIIDANVGLTKFDLEMIKVLKENRHNVIIVANKVDKIPKNKRVGKIEKIKNETKYMQVIEYSAKTNEGREELLEICQSYI